MMTGMTHDRQQALDDCGRTSVTHAQPLQSLQARIEPCRTIGEIQFCQRPGDCGYTCTGTLIGTAAVLTAGHCLYELGTAGIVGLEGGTVGAISVRGPGHGWWGFGLERMARNCVKPSRMPRCSCVCWLLCRSRLHTTLFAGLVAQQRQLHAGRRLESTLWCPVGRTGAALSYLESCVAQTSDGRALNRRAAHSSHSCKVAAHIGEPRPVDHKLLISRRRRFAR